MFNKWQLINSKECSKLYLNYDLSDTQIEQIFQQQKYNDSIFIKSNLPHNRQDEIGRNLKNYSHLKGFGIQFNSYTFNDYESLKLIAENLLIMKDLNHFQLFLDCSNDSSKYLSEMTALAQNLSQLENLTHLSFIFKQSRCNNSDVSNLFNNSLKNLNQITHLEYKFEVYQQRMYEQSSLQHLFISLENYTNLICLQIQIGSESDICDESLQDFSSSLDKIHNLQHLSVQFDSTSETNEKGLLALKCSLVNLKVLKTLSLEFNDYRFSFLEQFDLFDAMFQSQELENFSVKTFYVRHYKHVYKFGTNTCLHSKIKNLKFIFRNYDDNQDNSTIYFGENILRITKLESLVLQLNSMIFGKGGRNVFDQLLQQNTSLKKIKIKNANYSTYSLDFFVSLKHVLRDTFNLKKLSLLLKNEIYLLSLIKSFSNESNLPLEEFKLDIDFHKLTEDVDLSPVFQPMKNLKKLDLSVRIYEENNMFSLNLILSLSYLQTLESLRLFLFILDINYDKDMFRITFNKLINLRYLEIFIPESLNKRDDSGRLSTLLSFTNLINLQFLCLHISFDSLDQQHQKDEQIKLVEALKELKNLRVFEYAGSYYINYLEYLILKKLLKIVIITHRFVI